MSLHRNIFVTGFSGSGKTTVGRIAARLLGWAFVDLDDDIERTAGLAIEQIFARYGEVHFRRLESERLAAACERDMQVVSTGGGIVVDWRNRRAMERAGAVVCLEARPETLFARVERQAREDAEASARPMLFADDALARIRSLKTRRQFAYTHARLIVHTDDLSPEQAAMEVVRGWKDISETNEARAAWGSPDLAAVVETSGGDYPVWVGWDIMDRLGERVIQTVGETSTTYIFTDEHVYSMARRAQSSLERAGIAAHIFIMPAGEQHKTLKTVELAYDWLSHRRAERGHLVLALGGGVVGDLAGFVAATYVRGMPFAQVPTSLLAMMDASIGGKVAVDLPRGKNLVGAFYQPRLVLSDVSTLRGLPARQMASGWAEAIKHGLILDEDLLADFDRQRDALLALEPEAAAELIRRSVAIKANVVSRDERETLGVRVLLNYGHTIGHAIEAATGYDTYLHGEAVSVGMMGAANIALHRGLLDAEAVERQADMLRSFGLPLSCEGVSVDAIEEAMRSDKKVSAGSIRWVLLDGIGNAVTRNDVPPELVRQTLERLAVG